MIDFNIDKLILPAYKNSVDKLWNFIVGSRGSGKTSFVVSLIVYYALLGKSSLVIRNLQGSHKDSTYSEIIEFLENHLPGLKYKAVTSPIPRIQIEKSVILFGGMDKPEKFKSMKPLKSNAIELIWFEETTEILDKLNFKEAQEQINKVKFTFGRSKQDAKVKIVLTYNPDKPNHWLEEKEKEIGFNENEKFTRTTFLDNHYLNEDFIQELKTYEKIWPEYYRQIAYAEWMQMGQKVYENVENYVYTTPNKTYHTVSVGVDLGIDDATTFVATGWSNSYNEIEVFENFEHSNRKSKVKKDFNDYANDFEIWYKILKSKNPQAFFEIFVDSESRGATFKDMLAKKGIYIKLVQKNKIIERIMKTNFLFRNGNLMIKHNLPVLNDLKNSIRNPESNKKEDAVRLDGNDHNLTAMEYSQIKYFKYVKVLGKENF